MPLQPAVSGLPVPESHFSPAAMLMYPSPHSADLQLAGPALPELQLGESIGPGSHCSGVLGSTMPLPHTRLPLWHRLSQVPVGEPLSLPSSHSSPLSTTRLPHSW